MQGHMYKHKRYIYVFSFRVRYIFVNNENIKVQVTLLTLYTKEQNSTSEQVKYNVFSSI